MRHLPALSALTLATLAAPTFADVLTLQIGQPPAIGLVKHMGAQSATQGDIGWDAASLVRDGKPWIPVMGEFHYSRYPNAEWRDELLKMKAGGSTLVATYVFWIHHEEEQGKFTWDGDKDLRKFIETCKDVGLPVIVRMGPWCHGEVRNGGFPDWVQALPRKRTNDPQYLAAVTPYYQQIAAQMKGLYWKDGGPIVGIQFENEFKGPAAHLVTLKQIGKDAGIDVPIYTRTAWDNATNVPTFGEVLPLWGGYAEGFWDRELTTMPGNYWQVFQFARDRSPSNAMGSDPTRPVTPGADGDVQAYPYLTCELGGGMMSSYHRRIDIAPMDVYSVALTKVGSGSNMPGSNMPGYYMYHGGNNPEGKLSYLMESQSPPQNMWNDMPVKNYDFGAVLGAAGEVRDSYHLTRMLHLFLNDWGQQLARMPAYYGGIAQGKTDAATVRWAVRSDGNSGFLFVNNYQRAQDMPAKPNTQFDVKLLKGEVKIPADGTVTVPANSSFIWPINMALGNPDAILAYATAQPICKLTDGDTTFAVFAQIPGIPADFQFAKGATIDTSTGPFSHPETGDWTGQVAPSLGSAIRLHTRDGKKQVIFLVGGANSNGIWKATATGKEAIFFSRAPLTFDGQHITLNDSGASQTLQVLGRLDLSTELKPAAKEAFPITGDTPMPMMTYLRTNSANDKGQLGRLALDLLKPAGALRTIPMGSQKVAAEPTDADFDNAAVWTIKIPDAAAKSLLRLHYTGDVARIYLGDGGGKFILDDFYHGEPLDLALWRFSKEDLARGLTIKILPLQKNAPIYMAQWPKFDGNSVARIDSTELIEQRQVTLTAK